MKTYYVYRLINGKKENIDTYIVSKNITKEDIKIYLKDMNIKYDGIDSVCEL